MPTLYAANEADLPHLSTASVAVKGTMVVTNASLAKDGSAASYNANSVNNNAVQWNIGALAFEALLAQQKIEHEEPIGYLGVYEVTGLAVSKYVKDNKAPKGPNGEQPYGIINTLTATAVQPAAALMAAPVDIDTVGVENARGGQILGGNYEGGRYASGNTGATTASGATAVQFRVTRRRQPEAA